MRQSLFAVADNLDGTVTACFAKDGVAVLRDVVLSLRSKAPLGPDGLPCSISMIFSGLPIASVTDSSAQAESAELMATAGLEITLPVLLLPGTKHPHRIEVTLAASDGPVDALAPAQWCALTAAGVRLRAGSCLPWMRLRLLAEDGSEVTHAVKPAELRLDLVEIKPNTTHSLPTLASLRPNAVLLPDDAGPGTGKAALVAGSALASASEGSAAVSCGAEGRPIRAALVLRDSTRFTAAGAKIEARLFFTAPPARGACDSASARSADLGASSAPDRSALELGIGLERNDDAPALVCFPTLIFLITAPQNVLFPLFNF